MVYVLNRYGKPLMPTTRYGRVRRLLRKGLAVASGRTTRHLERYMDID